MNPPVQRLVCVCHWVRHPPGIGPSSPTEGIRYMAATKTGPYGVNA